MSKVASCPTCGSKSKIKEANNKTIYQTLQDDYLVKKVGQMKKAMQKYKEQAEQLKKQLEEKG